MKKAFFAAVLAISAVLGFVSCAAGPKVRRVPEGLGETEPLLAGTTGELKNSGNLFLQ
ncbi:MAG: hypothetical protein LBP19_02815 [Treponema sp.]|nr:hypothetical protein [Treponema sp.]